MKKLPLALSLAIYVLSSCNDAGKPSTTVATDSRQEELAKIHQSNTRKVYDAAESGDVSGLDSLMDKNFVDHDGINGGDMKGVDSLKLMIGDMHNHVKNLKMEIQSIASNDEYGFDLVRLTGTAADASWGMPAGTKIDSRSVNLVKFKNGKAVEHWRFMDVNEAMAMMNQPPMADKKTSRKK